MLFLPRVEAENNQEDEFNQNINYTMKIIPSRSLKGGSGDIKFFENEWEYDSSLTLFKKLPIDFSVNAESITIDKTTSFTLPSHLTGVGFETDIKLPFFSIDSMHVGININPSFYGEKWQFTASNFSVDTDYFLCYQPNKQWTWEGGVILSPLSDTRDIAPFLGFIYRPNEQLTFDMNSNNPQVSYAVNDRTTLFVEGNFLYYTFVVNRNGSKNVNLDYNTTTFDAGVKFKINRFVKCSLAVGELFNDTFKYQDTQEKISINNGFYGQLGLEVDF